MESIFDALQAQADDHGVMSYAAFSEVALYHPQHGYYQQARPRVGQEPGTDFHTSVSLGPLFGTLIAAAARKLVAPMDPRAYTLVEIGAEPGGGMFAEVDTGFGDICVCRLGDPARWPEHAVVVANEVLDAQPFHRLVYRGGRWRELGVRVDGSCLTEVEIDGLSPAVQARFGNALPESASEGYHLDLSPATEDLLAHWAERTGCGGMILIDYGKNWAELAGATPQGTARAYWRHRQGNDLLARPGDQDLTTHVCWDRLERVLRERGFSVQPAQRQEAFLVKNAWEAIERLAAEGTSDAPLARRQLQDLLHPSSFGARFQVMTAERLRQSP